MWQEQCECTATFCALSEISKDADCGKMESGCVIFCIACRESTKSEESVKDSPKALKCSNSICCERMHASCFAEHCLKVAKFFGVVSRTAQAMSRIKWTGTVDRHGPLIWHPQTAQGAFWLQHDGFQCSRCSEGMSAKPIIETLLRDSFLSKIEF